MSSAVMVGPTKEMRAPSGYPILRPFERARLPPEGGSDTLRPFRGKISQHETEW